MITDELRVLAADPRGVEIANLYLHAIEADDVSGLKRLMKPGVTLAHANYPPVRGRDEAVSMIHGYRQIVGGVEFEVHTLFGGEGLIAIEKVNFMAIRGGSRARVPTMTILEFDEDGRIFSIRIYADIADLFRKLESGHGAIARP